MRRNILRLVIILVLILLLNSVFLKSEILVLGCRSVDYCSAATCTGDCTCYWDECECCVDDPDPLDPCVSACLGHSSGTTCYCYGDQGTCSGSTPNGYCNTGGGACYDSDYDCCADYWNCGTCIDDCGFTDSCGTCNTNPALGTVKYCQDNQCWCDTSYYTCSRYDRDCGTWSTPCGSISCGSCPSGTHCSYTDPTAGTCVTDATTTSTTSTTTTTSAGTTTTTSAGTTTTTSAGTTTTRASTTTTAGCPAGQTRPYYNCNDGRCWGPHDSCGVDECGGSDAACGGTTTTTVATYDVTVRVFVDLDEDGTRDSGTDYYYPGSIVTPETFTDTCSGSYLPSNPCAVGEFCENPPAYINLPPYTKCTSGRFCCVDGTYPWSPYTCSTPSGDDVGECTISKCTGTTRRCMDASISKCTGTTRRCMDASICCALQRAGTTVTLLRNSTGATYTDVTDTTGTATFSNRSRSNYTLTLTVPTGYHATTTNPQTFLLSSNRTVSFGIAPDAPATTTTTIATYTVTGQIFIDANKNGTKDTGESCYEGSVTISVGGEDHQFQSATSCNTYTYTVSGQCPVVNIVPPTNYESTGWYGTDDSSSEISGSGGTAYLTCD